MPAPARTGHERRFLPDFRRTSLHFSGTNSSHRELRGPACWTVQIDPCHCRLGRLCSVISGVDGAVACRHVAEAHAGSGRGASRGVVGYSQNYAAWRTGKLRRADKRVGGLSGSGARDVPTPHDPRNGNPGRPLAAYGTRIPGHGHRGLRGYLGVPPGPELAGADGGTS